MEQEQNKKTKENKPKYNTSNEKLNQQSTLRTVHMCVRIIM